MTTEREFNDWAEEDGRRWRAYEETLKTRQNADQAYDTAKEITREADEDTIDEAQEAQQQAACILTRAREATEDARNNWVRHHAKRPDQSEDGPVGDPCRVCGWPECNTPHSLEGYPEDSG